MVCLFSQASGSALVPLKCKAWIPSKAPFSGLNDLWFSSHFAIPCLGQEMGWWAVLSHHTKKWTGKDDFHIAVAPCKLNGPQGLSRCSALEVLKRYLGAAWKGGFFKFLPSDTNAKLFRLQRKKLDVPGRLFFILSKGWISQHWVSSAGPLLLCICLKTLTSAIRLIYSIKGVKSAIVVWIRFWKSKV